MRINTSEHHSLARSFNLPFATVVDHWIFSIYSKLWFLSHQLILSVDILNFKIELLTKKERSPVTSLERSWPSQEELVSKLLTTNKRTIEKWTRQWCLLSGHSLDRNKLRRKKSVTKARHRTWPCDTQTSVEQKSNVDGHIMVLIDRQNNLSVWNIRTYKL